MSRSLFRDPGPQNRSSLFLNFREISFLISEAFGKECQGPKALISSEMGHRIIWFHCAHIFTSHWLCARTMLNVRSADMNQTWPLDFSFTRGERRAKKTKYKDTHILSEEWGRGSLVGLGGPWGQRKSAEAEKGAPGRGNGTSRGPSLTSGTKETAIRLNEVMPVFLQMGSPDAFYQHHLG